jgi:hypothetical protein
MHIPNNSGAAEFKESAVVDRVTVASKCRVESTHDLAMSRNPDRDANFARYIYMSHASTIDLN